MVAVDVTRRWIRLVLLALLYGAVGWAVVRLRLVALDDPWFVMSAMVCALGLAFVAKAVVTLRVPRWWRQVRPREVNGAVYRVLRVRAFGTLLRTTPLRFLNLDVYARPRENLPQALLSELEAAEASHLWAGMLVAPYMGVLVARGAWGTLATVTLVQIVGNLYPILHLRLARHRVTRVSQRWRASHL